MKEKVSLGMGLIGGLASYFLGGFDTILSVFVTILIADTLTGMLKAWNLGEYESKKFRSGFVKKVGYFIGVILAVQLDALMGNSGILRDAVLTFFIANEALSIVENMGQMGVKFPDQISNAIKSLGAKEDKE